MDLLERFFPDEKIRRIFVIAKEAAEESDSKYKIGAVLTKNSRILGVGCNRNNAGFRIVVRSRYHGLHAEIAAVRDALKKYRIDLNFDITTVSSSALELLEGTTIWVFRSHKITGFPVLARPCEVCHIILPQLGVEKAVYTMPAFPYYKSELLN